MVRIIKRVAVVGRLLRERKHIDKANRDVNVVIRGLYLVTWYTIFEV